MFRLSLLFVLDHSLCESTLGHILQIQCLPFPVQTFLLLPLTLLTQPTPLSPIPLQQLQIQFHNLHLTPPPPSLLLRHRPPLQLQPPPQPVPEISSETSAPSSTLRVLRLYPTSLDPLPSTPSRTPLKQETSPQDSTPFCAPLFPLREVAGAEGIVWVHVPFSLTNLSQVEKHLGFFSSDPDNY